MDLVMLGAIAVFAAVLLVAAAAQDYLAERRGVYRTLRTMDALDLSPQAMRQRELAAPVTTRIVLPGLQRVGRRLRAMTPAGTIERLRRLLDLAGAPEAWDPERLMAYKMLGLIGVGFAGLAFGLVARWPLYRAAALLAISVVGGWYLTDLVVLNTAQRRQQKIQKDLPDALDLLSITVEAGLGFDAALRRVSRLIHGPLGGELYRVVQEMQLGKSRSDSLRDLSGRTTVSELKSFVLAMVQADTFGISIANVLRVQADEMRLKRRQRAEEKAQKLPVKIIFPLLFCIFPSIFVVLLGPAVISIYENVIQR